MKTKIILSMVITISACVSIAGQTEAQLQQVTLYYFWHQQPDASRSSINFETGKRGQLRGEPHTDFDLTYGGTAIGRDGKWIRDWFRVVDSRSMIVDLGSKKWQDINETPAFPKAKTSRPPLPLTNRPIVVDVSAGSTDVSPYRQIIEVKPGHIYLMRVLHGSKAVYAMFRVETLSSGQDCVLSFKLVVPPKVDNEK